MKVVLQKIDIAKAKQFALLMLFGLVVTNPALASTATGMPWEGPLQNLINSLTGPVAQMAGIAAIVITGLTMAFTEGGAGMKLVLRVVLGLSIAFAATSWGLGFMGYGGALTV